MARTRTIRAGSLVTSMRDDLLEAVTRARSRVDLVSPFLSTPVAEALAYALRTSKARVRMLTALDPRAAAVGALSLDGLLTLLGEGVSVRHLGNLHAKVVLVDNRLAVVGSGNLTGRGLGGGPDANVELGVALTPGQRKQVERLVDQWWREAEDVTSAKIRQCERQAKKIRVPMVARKTQGPVLDTGSNVYVEGARRRGASGGFWLKMHRDVDDVRWHRRRWVSSGHRMGANGRPLQKPSFQPGDLLVIYSVEPGRCTAVLGVTGEPEFAPEVVRERDGEEAALTRAWVTPIRTLHQTSPNRGPSLAAIGVNPLSVRQKGHIQLTPDQYRRAYRRIARTRARVGAPRVASEHT